MEAVRGWVWIFSGINQCTKYVRRILILTSTNLKMLVLLTDWLYIEIYLVIPKLEIIFPSEVQVSSDKRPYRNLTFDNVLALQSSSFWEHSKLLHCVTWNGKRLSHRSKDEFPLKFLPSSSACTRRSIYFNISEL